MGGNCLETEVPLHKEIYMIVLVTGGRDFNDLAATFDAIATLHTTIEIECIVHGDAKGADTLADQVAEKIGIDRIAFPANWTKHGKAAGPIRNRHMLDRIGVDLVLAFPGGNGTADMIKQAQHRGIEVVQAIDILNA